jgi:hypothetical protein
MKKEHIIKVFMIHKWIQKDLQKDIANQLKSDQTFKFKDLSFPTSNPIPTEMYELGLMDDYACGAMMESDIVIVLPDTDRFFDYYTSDDEDPGDGQPSSFGYTNSSGYKQAYNTEVVALIHDSCNTKPVLVLGWSETFATNFANRLKSQKKSDSYYNSDRFYAMGLNHISESNSIAKKIVSILNNYRI